MKKAFVTGITGQDGSYLAELLIAKGYEVHGIIRRASTFNTQRIDHIYIDPHESKSKLILHYGDLSDPGIITELIYNIKPDEIYHLGAQSHVRVSFDLPEYTGNISGLGATRLLEAIRRSGIKTKYYQASTSELFGSSTPPQNESTAFYPRSPYAIAKLYSYWTTINYREAYGIFASNGILFNHESPRRGETFVTRKITRAIAQILTGKQQCIYLGNIDAKRDWGFAPEFVEVMWKMLQCEKPDDFVIGTGTSYSVRDFLNIAFNYCGIEIEWKGNGIDETGVVKSSNDWIGSVKPGTVVVKIDSKYFRPTEVENLQADITKARKMLDWQPKVTFEELIKIMIDYDMMRIGLNPKGEGIKAIENKGYNWTNHEFKTIT